MNKYIHKYLLMKSIPIPIPKEIWLYIFYLMRKVDQMYQIGFNCGETIGSLVGYSVGYYDGRNKFAPPRVKKMKNFAMKGLWRKLSNHNFETINISAHLKYGVKNGFKKGIGGMYTSGVIDGDWGVTEFGDTVSELRIDCLSISQNDTLRILWTDDLTEKLNNLYEDDALSTDSDI